MRESKLLFNVKETSKVTLEKKIKRGKESWGFIYFVFGILLALLLFLISIPPISWGYKVIIFIVVLLFLIYLCLFNTWFQNRLIGFKIKLEETWRKI